LLCLLFELDQVVRKDTSLDGGFLLLEIFFNVLVQFSRSVLFIYFLYDSHVLFYEEFWVLFELGLGFLLLLLLVLVCDGVLKFCGFDLWRNLGKPLHFERRPLLGLNGLPLQLVLHTSDVLLDHFDDLFVLLPVVDSPCINPLALFKMQVLSIIGIQKVILVSKLGLGVG